VFEDDNCVNQCVSQACFASVYAAEPLEAGEVDHVRWARFSECVANEVRTEKRKVRDQRMSELLGTGTAQQEGSQDEET
jgi:hypothetical protein